MIEDILDQLKAVIVADLPAKLVAITAEKGDTITLPDILGKNIYITEKHTIQNYPAMLIIGIATSIEEEPTQKDLSHDIVISCAVTGTVEEITTRKIYRYLEGVKRVLESNRKLNNTVIDTSNDRHFYQPTFADSKGSFLKDFTMKITVTEQEDYAI